LLIYLHGEVSNKGCNCSSPFERKGNWISVNAFLYFNSKVCKRLPNKMPIGKKHEKMLMRASSLVQWTLDLRNILGETKIFLKSRFFLISNTRKPLKKHNFAK
jgi:hypothetical protein